MLRRDASQASPGLGAEDVDDVLLGQVLTATQGQNPARRAAIGAGIPKEKTAKHGNKQFVIGDFRVRDKGHTQC